MNIKMEPKLSRIGCALFRAENENHVIATEHYADTTEAYSSVLLLFVSTCPRLYFGRRARTCQEAGRKPGTRSRATIYLQVHEDAVPDK